MSSATDRHFLSLQEALAGRYSLERELGRGGMGIVYLAHEVALDRPVALKLLPGHLAATPGLRERFLREARTSAKLSHPHIVPIHAVDQVLDFVFFAMAYVNGETLGQRIRARGPLPPSEAVRILREVAWALAYAHAQGVIHRDVKPDNILLESSTGRAMVTDFGIASVKTATGEREDGRTGDLSSGSPGLTMGIIGTPEFMSPEQATGEPVDGRSDLYALGCVGYYVLSGRVPFDGPTVPAIIAKHITQPHSPLAKEAPETPARLVRAMDRCLAKNPEERFATGEALAEALAEGAVTRKELPVPLRVFLKRSREAFQSIMAFGIFTTLVVFPWVIGTAVAGSLSGFVAAVGIGGALMSAPFFTILYQVRKLAKAGYGLEDLRLAVRDDMAQREEELRFEFGRSKSMITKAAYPALAVSITGLALSAGGAITMSSPPQGLMAALGISMAGFAVSGAIVARHHARTRDVWGKRSVKFWMSRVGAWFHRLATRGISRAAAAMGVTHRPTELAIGLAADRLFEELPKKVRAQLADLPQTVRRLEADAQAMRARVEELNALLAQAGAGPTTQAADRRGQLRERLDRERDNAEGQLRDAVTALETVRLNLLRMHAGVADARSMTTDLEAARDVSAAVARLVEGQGEVEAMLKSDPSPQFRHS